MTSSFTRWIYQLKRPAGITLLVSIIAFISVMHLSYQLAHIMRVEVSERKDVRSQVSVSQIFLSMPEDQKGIRPPWRLFDKKEELKASRVETEASYKLKRSIPIFAISFSIIALSLSVIIPLLKHAKFVSYWVEPIRKKNKQFTYELFLCNEAESSVVIFGAYFKNNKLKTHSEIPMPEKGVKLGSQEPLRLQLTRAQSKLFDSDPKKVSIWISTNVGKIKCTKLGGIWEPTP